MKHLKLIIKDEQAGQSIVIIAFALVALLGLVALVVDGGNAYLQRRQTQNAVDAGSQAGSVMMGLNKNIGNSSTAGTIDYAIRDYVRRNGVDPSTISWHFVTQTTDGSGHTVQIDDTRTNTYWTTNCPNSPAPKYLPTGTISNCAPTSGNTVVGVKVTANKNFSTYFGGIVGWRQMNVGALAPSCVPGGASGASNLFPIALSDSVFDDTNNDGIKDVVYEDTSPTASTAIFESNTQPRRFVYISWSSDTSSSTLVSNINSTTTTTSPSGLVTTGQKLKIVTATMNSTSGLYTAMTNQTDPDTLTVPVYDHTSVGTDVTVLGFARIKIVSGSIQKVSNNNGQMNVKFQHYVDATGNRSSAPNFGVESPAAPCTYSTSTRNLQGSVKIQQLNPVSGPITNTHIPVDVVNVLDISGSMNDSFGSTSKLSAAKTALTSFNNNMQPSLGDKVALVTFPDIQNVSRYYLACDQSNSYTQGYYGKVRNTLTTNISSVNSTINGLSANGGTPIGDGMRLGRLTALGTGHVSGHVAVLILASDGIANITLNGQWTGFQGNVYDDPPCNDPAVQDAIAQANAAKSDSDHDGEPDIIVFTIAVGNDFNPDSMQAMATTDTNPSKPHYFRVTDAASMTSIYNQIADRVQQIGEESCSVYTTYPFANGASVTVRKPDGTSVTVTTNSQGQFEMTNVAQGTYTITGATVTVNGFTYDVMTDGVGGPDLTSNPTVAVSSATTTYATELDLRTDDSVSCPGS